MRRILRLAGFVLPLAVAHPFARAADLEKDALDVFARRCLSCHGARTRAAGLDLSTRDGALKGGSRGAALKPGAAQESLLWSRVASGQMPPTAPLPESEQQIVRQWIESGAPWTGVLSERRAGLDWWALKPLLIREPPASAGIPDAWSKSPLDAWIYAKLKESGLAPSPPADKAALARRASYDVTGLPPTPKEIDEFVNDRRPDAYERMIDRLLASPRYGEHWARHWLDVVRFAESEGFERDWLRDRAWPYRDYVIRSFNQDKPYQLFAKEQIAGDVLPPVTHDGIVATSMLVLGPYDAVGLTSAVPQERAMVREDQLEEMVGVVAQTFLGLTVNCARCHDHKFDPIPQKDYYRLKAFFEGVWQPTEGDELKADGRALLTPPEQKDWENTRGGIERRVRELEESLGALHRAARRTWIANRGMAAGANAPAPFARWTLDADSRDDSGSLSARMADTAELSEGRLKPAAGKDTASVMTLPLPMDIREKTLEAWIYVAKAPEKPVAVLRIRNRSGFRGASVDGIQFTGAKTKQWENLSTVRFRSETVEGPPEETPPGERVHIAIVYAADNSIQLFRNGRPYGKPYTPDSSLPAGVLQTYFKDDAVIELGASQDLHLEEARVYAEALTPEQVEASFRTGAFPLTPSDLEAAMTAEQRSERVRLEQQLTEARKQLNSLPQPEKAFAAEIRKPDTTYLLIRGSVNNKGPAVTPAGLSCLKTLPAEMNLSLDAPDGERRRKLAEWIANESNPLFARVIVNRVWHYFFGRGLMENPNDFGFNGGVPSHPELLDWLAGEFIRGGWSVKKLQRLILTSGTYRQSSAANRDALAKDAENKLLWRYAPHRLPGEAVRDAMLAVSGRMNPEMFGPSFRPFQIVKNSGSYHTYEPVDSDSPEQQRRTVYRMNVNSGGNPMLEALDCPVPSVKTPRRTTTTTALQALSLMNNAFVQRQAKAFAARLAEEAPDTAARVERGFVLALGRPPKPGELESSRSLVEQHGLEAFCWGLFNTSEFLYVE
jgi:hypothetical protein